MIKQANKNDILTIEEILIDAVIWMKKNKLQNQWNEENIKWNSLSKDYEINGYIQQLEDGSIQFGPMVLYTSTQNLLKYIDAPIGSYDKEKLEHFKKVLKNEADASVEGPVVFEKLKTAVLQ